MAALAIAELSTTEAFAACMSCLLCRGMFSCVPVVFVHDNDAWAQRRCSAGRMMCAQLPLDSQVWTALAIAKLSTTEAFAARASCLLCRSLFSRGHAVFVHDDNVWVQRRCSAGRMMCAQLPLDSQVWRRWQLPNYARPRHLPHARAVCSAAACFRAALRCLYTMMMRGCSGAAQRGA